VINILVSMRISENTSYVERRDAVAHDWVMFLAKYNVVPIFVPNNLPDPTIYFDAVTPAGLLLTGGDSLGDEDQLSERDQTEENLLARAVKLSLPVFGVCRGLQVINRFFGGGLSRQLEGNHVAMDHVVTINADFSNTKYYTKLMVNSYHKHGVEIGKLAPALEQFAISDDGIVEGLIHPDLPLVAVQWHPERHSPSAQIDQNLFSQWIKKCV
jgi:gamma-glutamyl-gamma-aminobutyrate hydrolase PuuD